MMSAQGSERETGPARRREHAARSLRARFRRLSRAKRLLLAWLAVLDLTLAAATAIYAFAPSPAAGQSTGSPVIAQATDAPKGDALPLVAGNFEQVGKGTQAELVLRQYDDAITGTYTQMTCAGGKVRVVQRIITGQALPDGTLRLTFSAPDLPPSLTAVYQVAMQPAGFVLSWRDQLGKPQTQRWLPEVTPLPPLACGE